MVPVTKSFIPPLSAYTAMVERAFQKEWLTNRGELVLELEEKLKAHLSVSNIIAMNNGTIPLQIALKLLGNQGEIITTPFSYVATTASIVWENCTPVFVDIDAKSLTIDASKIEAAITPKTSCILATHVFGNPCDIDAIDAIAQKHQLSVIYDAAHCFGVNYKGKSIFEYGDISTCSFHATKLFHTGEGGALFCNDKDLFDKCFYSHNFGHNGPLDFYGLGINGKLSELQAAMGLVVLPYMEEIVQARKEVVDFYTEHLDFSALQALNIRENTTWNYSYYPVLFETEEHLLRVQNALNAAEIFPRRYFYPSLNTIKYVQSAAMPVSENSAKRVLCLPIYAGLKQDELKQIAAIINQAIC